MRGPVPSRPALRLRAVRAPVGGCGAPISGSHFGFLRLAGYGRGVGSRPALPEGTRPRDWKGRARPGAAGGPAGPRMQPQSSWRCCRAVCLPGAGVVLGLQRPPGG